MATKQISRCTVLSPSTVLHIGIIEYRGNNLMAVTKCGTPINPTTWTRMVDVREADSKCERCFPTS